MKLLRVQRKRTKGFKLPPNTVCVNRGTMWGNPFRVGDVIPTSLICILDPKDYEAFIAIEKILTNEDAVYLFRKYMVYELSEFIHVLKGKNVACFCKLSDACHGDVLLEWANS